MPAKENIMVSTGNEDAQVDPREIFKLVAPNSSPRSSPYILRGIEAIHDAHPEWLTEVRDAILSGASTGTDFEWIFKAISGSTSKEKINNLVTYSMWLRVHLSTLPLLTRYKVVEPDLSVIKTTASARHAFQIVGLMDPTYSQMQAAAMYGLIIRGAQKKPTLDEINFVAAHLDDIEVLLPELVKRRAFDKGVIEALMNASVAVLLAGEL